MSARAPDGPIAAPAASVTRWPVMVMAAAAVGVATWLWLRDHTSPADGLEPEASNAAPAGIQSPAPPTSTTAGYPGPRPSGATDSAPANRPRAASTASGKLHLELPVAGGGQLTSLDMAVGDGVAVWQPREHRLRVLLVDEAMSPSDHRQMLDYLQSERLADSGRAHAVLEMYFRPNAKTFDRNALDTASLTVTNSDGTVSASTDVHESLRWRGAMPAAAGGGGATSTDAVVDEKAAGSSAAATAERQAVSASPTLEMSASGAGASPGSPIGRDSWQLSVAIPVTQAR